MKAITAASATLPELAAEINREHRACEASFRQALSHAIIAGKLLTEAKALCAHGEWGPWLAANFEGSDRTARGYMQLAAHLPEIEGKRRSVADLGIGESLKLLAEPREEAGPTSQEDLPSGPVRVNAVDAFTEARDKEIEAALAYLDESTHPTEDIWDDPRIKTLLGICSGEVNLFAYCARKAEREMRRAYETRYDGCETEAMRSLVDGMWQLGLSGDLEGLAQFLEAVEKRLEELQAAPVTAEGGAR